MPRCLCGEIYSFFEVSLKQLGKVLASVLVFALTAELALQIVSHFAPQRDKITSQGRQLILAIGDSHVYGAGVPVRQSLPARLQQLLDRESPGRYAVLNLGIPGSNTSQVRQRLIEAVDTYRPALVLVCCGVNNVWNLSGADDAEVMWLDTLGNWAYRSRLYRYVRVWLHQREIDASLEGVNLDGQHQPGQRKLAEDGSRWRYQFGGTVEIIDNERGERRSFDAVEERGLSRLFGDIRLRRKSRRPRLSG